MIKRLGILVLLCLTITGCGFPEGEAAYPDTRDDLYKHGSITGEQGITLLGGDDKKSAQPGISVNAFLWRAALDTISFMPLTSADPFGGVIITDWYSAPETPDERAKITVYILSQDLRADGIRVSAFRQKKQAGAWVDTSVAKQTTVNLEDAILTRARQLRIQSAATED